jgi:hypothetical protein
MTPNENAAPGWHPGSGGQNYCTNNCSPACAAPAIGPAPTLARVIPITYARRVGGPAWRRRHKLMNWRDLARDYAERRFVRPGALVPLPEDLIPGWRRTPC